VTFQEHRPPAVTAAEWSVLETFQGAGSATLLLGGPAAGAAAVDWTPAPEPAEVDWRPCAALGAGRWRLDAVGTPRAIGVRYRLAPDAPASPVSADRKPLAAGPAPVPPAPVPPALVPPVLLAAPALAGSGRIGAPVTADPGRWGGTPAPGLAIEWRRDGAPIAGATGASYVPGPGDDRTALTARITATSATGSLRADTPALAVTHAPPEALGTLPEEILDADTGLQEIAAAGAFRGAGLSFSVAGAGASVDAVSGLVLIPTDAAVDGAEVTVTATNSGGAAAQSFLVTVEATGPELPLTLADGYLLAEAPEAAGAAETGAAETGAATAGRIPVMPAPMLQAAMRRPLLAYRLKNPGVNDAWAGPAPVVLAMSSFAGNAATDTRLKRQIRTCLVGRNAPVCDGGFPAQFETTIMVTFVIARNTPRVWSDLADGERRRIELLLKAGLVAGAYCASDRNPDFLARKNPQRNLRGLQSWRNGNPNFRLANPALVQAAVAYFGAEACADFLDGYDHAAFRSELQAADLANTVVAFTPQPRWPTAAEIQDAVRNWTYRGNGLADVGTMFTSEVGAAFKKPVAPGLNDGAGILSRGGVYRGRIMAGADGLPNRGARGMAQEFDARDARGPRSSMSYVQLGTRVALNWFCLMVASGLIDKSSIELHDLLKRMDVGMTDIIYKSKHGYLSYSKGGPPASNNEDWTEARFGETWGLLYTHGLWTDLLRPYLEA
jgi:hypothetical protein